MRLDCIGSRPSLGGEGRRGEGGRAPLPPPVAGSTRLPIDRRPWGGRGWWDGGVWLPTGKASVLTCRPKPRSAPIEIKCQGNLDGRAKHRRGEKPLATCPGPPSSGPPRGPGVAEPPGSRRSLDSTQGVPSGASLRSRLPVLARRQAGHPGAQGWRSHLKSPRPQAHR